jgi:hypothetical protein
MKSFSDFIKEEIDLRGNKGIPGDLMGGAERQARTNLGVNIDDPRQLREYGPQLMSLVGQSQQIMQQGLDRRQLEERFVKLETLAKNIVLAEYGELLEASDKPVNLIIKLLRPRKKVTEEIPEMGDIPSKPVNQEVIRDENLRKAVDKKKILNVLNQGEAKATKNIIQYSDLVEPGLREIFGNQWRTILDIWLQTTEIANKMDWIMPLDMKSQMMKNVPEGMAGACQVTWEKEETQEEEEETQTQFQEEPQSQIQEEPQSQEEEEDEVDFEGDPDDYDSITVKAVGIDFPMLLHEAIKGIWALLKSGAIKEDEEMAKLIAQNTSSFEDESQDFRYGVAMQAMFRDFIVACKDSNKYSNMNARVYAKIALDKERGGDFTDGEFLELTKSLFSTFDLVSGRSLDFKLNNDKFNSSDAKLKIETIIAGIVEAEKEYERELAKWEVDTKLSNEPEYAGEEDDEKSGFNDYLKDAGISKADEKEVQKDVIDMNEDELSELSKTVKGRREIQEIVDDLLEKGEYEKIPKFSKYLKEGHEIYLREIAMINEKKLHNRRN